jgi:hypothetical protein
VDTRRPLTEAEAEAMLGRPLAHGVSFEDYRIMTGRRHPSSYGDGLGGSPRDVEEGA